MPFQPYSHVGLCGKCHGVESLDAVRNHQADSLHPTFLQFIKDITPSGGTFLRHIEYAKDLTGTFLRHGQCDIERLCRNRTFTMNFDMDAVHEHILDTLKEA